MKLLVCVYLFTGTLFIHAQDSNTTPEANTNGWVLSNYLGFSDFTVTDNFKINTQVYGGFAGYQFALGERYNLTTGINVNRFSGDFSTDLQLNQHISATFIGIPLLFGFNFQTESPVGFYIKGGVYGMYLVDSKVRIEAIGQDVDFDSNGLNVGLQADFGVLLKLSNRVNINIGIKSRSDLFESYNSDVAQVEITNFYALDFGLRIQSK